MLRSPYKYFLFTIVIIAIDQAIKLWMHFNPFNVEGQELHLLGNWFKLHYVLNQGMAFGMQLDFIPGGYGKMVLTLFRIAAMTGIGWYLVHLSKIGTHQGMLWSIAAILGGAIGNVIDSIFYGVFLDNAPLDAPTPWFHGQVIDMFYVDPWQGFLPDWLPFWGGQYYSNPIFNFADAAIFCGVVSILLFQNTFFEYKHPQNNKDEASLKIFSNEESSLLENANEPVINEKDNNGK
jgi:signal peptidase II